MSASCIKCPYCGRDNFESSRGLAQHQNRSNPCKLAMLEAYGLSQKKRRIAHDFMKTMPTNLAASKTFVHSGPNIRANAQKTMASGANNSGQTAAAEPGASDGWFMGHDALSSEEESDSSSDSDEELSAESDKSVRRDCIQYLACAQSNFIEFSRNEVNAIKPLWKSRQTTASLTTLHQWMLKTKSVTVRAILTVLGRWITGILHLWILPMNIVIQGKTRLAQSKKALFSVRAHSSGLILPFI